MTPQTPPPLTDLPLRIKVVTALGLLAILVAAAVGIALVFKATPSEAADSASVPGVWTTYTPAPAVQPQAAGRHKHPPSVNPCDDFALGLMAVTIGLGYMYYRRTPRTSQGS